ncbi:hypothetical protein [Flagellimonas meridianipacifica]|uniref:Lipocalin-like protein n=1 Tax=Flagellimonas meridianipacifica TaxID=1080225 RepID=A0A2T0M979_9FLAO|nr:hypothetical protein [Allomuricauda pacifica]PRX54029.1 hypothetical protein CLV81_2425 [Allomuricauda pacifica]
MMKSFASVLILFLFQGAIAQNTNTCSCCSENHLAFDFWVGEWTVTNANDSPAGENRIIKEEQGCVLRENWTSAKQGYTGTSINFYNRINQQWEQLWVDSSGAFLKLKGNRVGDTMVMSSEEFTKDGKTLKNRITWFKNEDGTVRQLWEVLNGDDVVSVLFDGLYRRK